MGYWVSSGSERGKEPEQLEKPSSGSVIHLGVTKTKYNNWLRLFKIMILDVFCCQFILPSVFDGMQTFTRVLVLLSLMVAYPFLLVVIFADNCPFTQSC
jgi:hypothetical protein